MRSFVVALIPALVGGAPAAGAENCVFRELTEQGVALATGDRIQAPRPSMPDGLGADEQEDILRKIASRYRLSEFLRDSRVAPFVLKMESIKDRQGQRTGQRIDLWFVAYGSLETLTDKELLDEIQTPGKPKAVRDLPSEARPLTAEELRQRGLMVQSTATMEDGFTHFNQPLFERVQLSGVVYSLYTKGPDSILAASKLDPRFAGDPELPNRWQPIDRDRYGKVVLGPPRPYSGYGMYAKVTPLLDNRAERTGALFIECHLVFDEPHDWFGGANLIRSKLPMAIKEQVQDFRRELKKHRTHGVATPPANGGRYGAASS